MANHPNRSGITVRLTAEERDTILHCIRIAAEDGSIYPTEMTDAAQKRSDEKTRAHLERIEAKLRGDA